MHSSRYLFLFALVVSCTYSWAQPKINSPLSRWGLGEDVLFRGHHLEMMGGLYAGFNDAALVNVVNPASLGFLKLTAFDIGLTGGSSRLSTDTQEESNNVGGLHHLTLAFPLRNSISEILERKSNKTAWAMGFDLRSNTRVGYDISVRDSIAEVGFVQREYVGSGGTYTFGWLNSYRFKNWSIGADIGVLFGNIENRRDVVFLDLKNPGNDRFEDDISIRSFRWKLGGQYRYQVNPKEENDNRKRYLTIGVYGSSNSDLNTSRESLYRSIRLIGGIQDTLNLEANENDNGVNPGLIGVGFTLQPNLKWNVGMNIELNTRGDYESSNLGAGEFKNGYKLGFGASYLPDANAFGKYFKRVKYKAGLQHLKDGRINSGDAITQTKVNFGMTMPFYYIRQFSHVHVGLEYARMDAGNLKENYYGVTLGVTFNDNQWFLKRKFN